LAQSATIVRTNTRRSAWAPATGGAARGHATGLHADPHHPRL